MTTPYPPDGLAEADPLRLSLLEGDWDALPDRLSLSDELRLLDRLALCDGLVLTDSLRLSLPEGD